MALTPHCDKEHAKRKYGGHSGTVNMSYDMKEKCDQRSKIEIGSVIWKRNNAHIANINPKLRQNEKHAKIWPI